MRPATTRSPNGPSSAAAAISWTPFARLEGVELWTSAATHAVLPLLATDAALRLQLATGTHAHTERFGAWDGGLWLPECAYAPGLERDLADHGVRAFCVDQTGQAGFDHLTPVATAAGPVALPIDWATVELVWNDRDGYPASDRYRDYHRRTVHDLKPWDNAGRPYRREAALRARPPSMPATSSTGRCGGSRAAACCAVRSTPSCSGTGGTRARPGSRRVLEEAPRRGLELVTVSDGLARVTAVERPLAASTWGEHKDLSTWDSAEVAEFAFTARAAELRTVAAAARDTPRRPALERAVRELLAMQSSDWAFMAKRELAADYPSERLAAHAAAHSHALESATTNVLSPEAVPEPTLRHLAPHLDLASLTTP